MSAQAQQVDSRRATGRDWLGLTVLCGAVLLIAIDGTVLDLAVPSMSKDLEPSSTQLLWIIDIYSFVLAALLVTMGVLSDRVGRRKLLMIGAAGFGLASIFAAFSTTPEMLIAARVLLGVFGATLMPSTLGLIRSMFHDSRQRATAIGVWGAMWGGGAAGGPLVGGWLLEHFWWGSVFLINVPVLIVMLILAPFLIPESRDPNPGRLDAIGAALSIVMMVPLVYALKEGAINGPTWSLVPIVALGVVAGWLFFRRQRRIKDPLIDVTLFSKPIFTTAILINLLCVFGLAGVLFFGTQYLQMVLGYSPLQAGLIAVPGTAASMLTALAAGWVARKWGNRWALAGSMLFAAIGALILLALRVEGDALIFAIGFGIIGLGSGLGLTLTSALVVDVVEPERAGAASGMSETSYELGIASGVAVLGSVVMAFYRGGIDVGGLSGADADAAQATLGGAVHVAHDLASPAGDAMFVSAQAAFVNGMHFAAGATAALMLITTGVVLVLLRNHPRNQ
ncbi:MFS transporter [Tomitella biformata]|uniref:MFS transporter n=1 Tax=Tomitella biformata TaxID=630403 RepID=UPI000466C2FE|nr:MFS transporter [Tomitella biformata]